MPSASRSRCRAPARVRQSLLSDCWICWRVFRPMQFERMPRLLDELIAAYKTASRLQSVRQAASTMANDGGACENQTPGTQAEFQASLSEFQQSFMDGQRDIRQYSVLLDPALQISSTPRKSLVNQSSRWRDASRMRPMWLGMRRSRCLPNGDTKRPRPGGWNQRRKLYQSSVQSREFYSCRARVSAIQGHVCCNARRCIR